MNILVLTNAMIDSHFAMYQDHAKIKPNPSNQNFYSKLIRTLAINNHVEVVTLRPFTKGMFKKRSLQEEKFESNGISYYYCQTQANKFYKMFAQNWSITRAAKAAIDKFNGEKFIIVVDTLKYGLLTVAFRLAKTYKVKVVGMLTDNPYNLSNVSKSYSTLLLSKAFLCDGFLSLTQKMVNNLNPNAPHYVFEGLVEEVNTMKKTHISNYYFFGGSLYERYGVKKLVDAFHASSCKCKLLVAGNGPLSSYVEKVADDDYRILALPQMSKNTLLSYEKNAIANINPRPLNEKLDSESIPSKLIEYLSIGVPVISTRNPKFYYNFKDEVYWINDNTESSLISALEGFESSNKEEMINNAQRAKEKVFELYSLQKQSIKIDEFLKSI